MRYKFIILLLLISSLSYSQITLKNWDYKTTAIGCAIGFMGGVASGYHETTLHHYPQFKKIHPFANDNYFYPAISWTQKYKNGDPLQGERFFLSTTVLVPFTDFYHLTNMIDRTSFLCATIYVTIGEKRPWWHYAINIASTLAARRIGFGLVYDYIYK